MANCDLDQLIDDANCLNCLSDAEKLDAFIYYTAQALNASDGGDYTDLNTLREAVVCWCVGGTRLNSFEAQVAINAAVNTGALEVAPTIAEIREAIKCYQCSIGKDEKQRMKVFLLCHLLETLVVD